MNTAQNGKNSNGDQSAFPIIEPDSYISVSHGLTKREQFAMAAMQGLSANYITSDWDYGNIAISSVKMADELLKELDK